MDVPPWGDCGRCSSWLARLFSVLRTVKIGIWGRGDSHAARPRGQGLTGDPGNVFGVATGALAGCGRDDHLRGATATGQRPQRRTRFVMADTYSSFPAVDPDIGEAVRTPYDAPNSLGRFDVDSISLYAVAHSDSPLDRSGVG